MKALTHDEAQALKLLERYHAEGYGDLMTRTGVDLLTREREALRAERDAALAQVERLRAALGNLRPVLANAISDLTTGEVVYPGHAQPIADALADVDVDVQRALKDGGAK